MENLMAGRAAKLLRPIRELAENWSVDVAAELETCLAELEAMASDGEYRFAEAALVVHGSAQVYCRKVEHLYQLVFRALDLVAVRDERGQRPGKRRAGRDQDDEGDDAYPLGGEDGMAQYGSQSLRVRDGRNVASAAVRGHLTMAAYRKYLEAEEEFLFLDELVPMAKPETIELEPYAGEEEEEEVNEWEGADGRRREVTIATPATPAMFATSGRRRRRSAGAGDEVNEDAEQGAAAEALLSRAHAVGDTDNLWVQWTHIHGPTGALLLDVVPAEAEQELALLGGAGAPGHACGVFSDVAQGDPTVPLADALDELGDAPWEAGDQGLPAAADPLEVDVRAAAPGPRRERRRRRAARNVDTDPWRELCEPDGGQGETSKGGTVRPFRRGRTYALPEATPEVEEAAALAKRVLRELCGWAQRVEQKPQSPAPEANLWARAKRLLRAPLLSLPGEAHNRGRHRRWGGGGRRNRRRAAGDDGDGDETDSASDVDDNLDAASVAEAAGASDPLAPCMATDGAGLPDTDWPMPDTPLDGLQDWPPPTAPVDMDAAAQRTATYEQLCRQYMEQTAHAWRRLQVENDLVQRVQAWHLSLEPQFQAETARPPFAWRTCREQLLRRLRQEASPSGCLALRDLCGDACRELVCRNFVVALQLAAEGLVHIQHDATADEPVMQYLTA
ncbi:hypothetical protein CDCA_CDCA01G0188 [Cyanidium caldarium]|uniref:Condensin-2 complex subunit H2 n=1 Tax=Cyanidium caldarium TaxID=2771 RepID=A0AAV9IPJ2_CYACA|nr:hypothetical protein CDCA_CDCA01G0188 [Cyanidium caldarium]